MDLNNAVMIVTGASSGIGASTARAAAEAGARLVLAARRHERISELAEQLADAIAVRCDVTEPAQVRNVVDVALERYGRVDVLINNAGQGLHEPLEDVDPEDFRAILELNTVAPLVAMQAVLPTMRAQGAGSIVNVSSGTTLRPFPGTGAYAASKAALNMLSAIARAEFADSGIAVSTVYPFITATEFHQVLRAGSGPARREGGPQAQTPEEVAAVILDLVRSGAERADLLPTRFGGSYTG
ncbi:SDR family NAD(P)-dependent oxidoreductase [Sinomonas humi]|uniref:Short-chain dehydrogenase n=1 Tax=Sinomonas humi TaxID=1338436 RepID=A0A0B2AJ16_9MICC|nr:SDR family oxidoreductase [Sinomonas humi]KHL03595.1 short-chain dehydrogenase [Sinomonas humi]